MIEIRGLVKRYPRTTDFLRFIARPFQREEKTALSGVDLKLEKGRIYGLVGSNGAGKTTLLKILAGLVLPTEGQVRIGGAPLEAGPGRAQERVGFVVADERSFYWRLSVRENLRFFATLQKVPPADIDAKIEECLEAMGLAGRASDTFQSLSTGMRQRLAVARGLLVDPPVLLLDEPTRSLDPAATLKTQDLIAGLLERDPERLVVVSSHDLYEVERICHHVVVLDKGRVTADVPLDAAPTEERYRIELRRALAADALDGLRGVRAEHHGWKLEVTLERPDVLDDVIDRIRERGVGLVSVEPLRTSVEELLAAAEDDA